jgi:hypothetical protein
MNVALRQEELYSCAFLSLTVVLLRNPWVYQPKKYLCSGLTPMKKIR